MGRATSTGLAISLAIFALLSPENSHAAIALRGQRLAPPDQFGSGFVYQSAVVKGDWIATFGRISDAAGDARVYVFHRQGSTWSFFQQITPPDGAASQDSIVMSDQALFVGSPNAADAQARAGAGTIAVYTLQNNLWQLSQSIYSYTDTNHNGTGFGASLALDGSTLYAGFPGYVSAAAVQTGNVEAYDVSAASASFIGQLAPSVALASTNFGYTVVAENGSVAVGANNQTQSGVGAGAGAVYTFTRTGSTWLEGDVLTSPYAGPDDRFPNALAMQNGTLLAGDVNCGSQGKEGPNGAAFSYSKSGQGYAFEAAFNPTDSFGYDMFGMAVASMDGLALMGAPNSGDAGRVYAYRFVHDSWRAVSVFTTQGLQDGDGFGASIATDGTTLIVGASESLRVPYSSGAIYAFDGMASDRIFGDGMEP
jgi:hypothetical protein